MIRTSRQRHRAGITLLEVLLALAIFLLALTAISRLVDFGFDSAVDAAYHSDAVRLAQSKMAEVEAGVITPDSNSSGTFDEEPGWVWQMQSETMDIPNLYTVTITVSRERGRSLTTTLCQIVFDSRYLGQASEIPKPQTTTGTTGASGS